MAQTGRTASKMSTLSIPILGNLSKQSENGGYIRMTPPKFPKTKKLMEAEYQAWKYVFEAIIQLRKRIKAIEQRIEVEK